MDSNTACYSLPSTTPVDASQQRDYYGEIIGAEAKKEHSVCKRPQENVCFILCNLLHLNSEGPLEHGQKGGELIKFGG